MTKQRTRLIITAIPIVICNLIAFTGQLSFIRDHMAWPLIGDIGLAAGIESIALFLAYMAHDALIQEDSAFKLRIGSYLAAGIAAGLNYSHYSRNGHPNFAAIATGLMSFASPILWGIYSRRISRDVLKAKGLIESRSVKFSAVRWLWWPGRTFRVFRLAAWSGEQEPTTAITQWESAETAKREASDNPPDEPKTLANAVSKADAVRIALCELGDSKASDVTAFLDANGWPGITPAYVRQIRSTDFRKRRTDIHALPEPGSPRALTGGKP
jgi:uncharacterized protein DUF2637